MRGTPPGAIVAPRVLFFVCIYSWCLGSCCVAIYINLQFRRSVEVKLSAVCGGGGEQKCKMQFSLKYSTSTGIDMNKGPKMHILNFIFPEITESLKTNNPPQTPIFAFRHSHFVLFVSCSGVKVSQLASPVGSVHTFPPSTDQFV